MQKKKIVKLRKENSTYTYTNIKPSICKRYHAPQSTCRMSNDSILENFSSIIPENALNKPNKILQHSWEEELMSSRKTRTGQRQRSSSATTYMSLNWRFRCQDKHIHYTVNLIESYIVMAHVLKSKLWQLGKYINNRIMRSSNHILYSFSWQKASEPKPEICTRKIR